MPAAYEYVVTETVFFGDDVAHHRVTVLDGEWQRWRMFNADPVRKGDRPRRHDVENNRLLHSQSARDFDRYPELNSDVPKMTHASFEAFLAHVGYSWARNGYRIAQSVKEAA